MEAVTSNYDGFTFNVNNAYLYAHPKDGRLILIPYGADSSFWAEARITKIRSPLRSPRILATAPATGRTAVDVKRFADYRPVIEAFINAGGTNGSAALP